MPGNQKPVAGLPPGAATLLVVTEVFRLLRLATWVGGSALIVYLAIPLPLSYTAGQETTVTLLFQFIANFKLHMVIPYAVAAGFFGLWLRERRTRKTSVKREHERVVKLEKKIDPGRTSS